MNSQQPNHPNQPDAHELDRGGAPANMLWGMILTILTFLLIIVCVLSIDLFVGTTEDPSDDSEQGDVTPPDDDPDRDQLPPDHDEDTPVGPDPSLPSDSYVIMRTNETIAIDASMMYSPHSVLVDVESRKIVAGLDYDLPIIPASMTKVMTLLVACEQLSEAQHDDIVMLPVEVAAAMQAAGASGVGFTGGDEMTVKDLLYAIALESDGIASVTLAIYVAGSEQAFVELMNQKAEEMGLISTTFVDCTGLAAVGQTTTCREMASIMIAAMENPLVKTLLSTKTYRTTTKVYPAGVTFLSTYGQTVESLRSAGTQTQPGTGTVVAAKTGYLPEAKYCLVTYFERASDGKAFVAVTAEGPNQYSYIVDYIRLYEDYAR